MVKAVTNIQGEGQHKYSKTCMAVTYITMHSKERQKNWPVLCI